MNLENHKLEHIQNLSLEEAHINLFSDIGGSEGISGQAFADELKFLNDLGVETINIHINSGGGSVIEGFSIFSAIKNSKATVNIFIEGIAASMAGVIAMAGDKIHMTDFSQIMIHNPSGGGDDENAQKALSALRDSLLVILNSRSIKSESKMSKIMDNETWLSPIEALDMGLIDEIMKTKKPRKQSAKAMMNIINSYISNNKNTINMKEVAKHFGLTEDADENSILLAAEKVSNDLVEANESLKVSNEALEVSNEKNVELEAKVSEFEASAKELNDKLVEETIDQAIKEGSFEADKKEELVSSFENNLAGLKLVIGSVKVAAPSVINQLDSVAPVAESKLPEDLKNLSWRELDKAGKLEAVKNISESEWNAKYVAEYGVNNPFFKGE